ncbi:MAG: hypothetical protein ACK5AK_01685, partial [Gemmatimonas sp.]
MRAARVVTAVTVSLVAALAAGCAGRVRPATVHVVTPAVASISLDARLLEMVDQRRPDTAL